MFNKTGIASILKTIQGQYGRGPFAFVKFLYYSFFRLNKFYLFELDLAEDPKSFEIESEYQMLSPSLIDLDILRERGIYPREFYMDRINGYQKCHVLLKEGDLVYIHWLRFPGEGCRFTRLKSGTVEITHIFSLPSERGKGLAKKAIAATATKLKYNGFRKMVAVVHEHNIASIKTFETLKFKPERVLKSFGKLSFKVNV
jgi:ribosomal protein S18 acetylase RimI-like enzyme